MMDEFCLCTFTSLHVYNTIIIASNHFVVFTVESLSPNSLHTDEAIIDHLYPQAWSHENILAN